MCDRLPLQTAVQVILRSSRHETYIQPRAYIRRRNSDARTLAWVSQMVSGERDSDDGTGGTLGPPVIVPQSRLSHIRSSDSDLAGLMLSPRPTLTRRTPNL